MAVEKRICKLCNSGVEDAFHFIMYKTKKKKAKRRTI